MTIAGVIFHSRRLLSKVLWDLGLFSLLYSPKVAQGVIMYHGVDECSFKKYNLRFCSSKDLYRQLLYFKKTYNILPLEDLFDNNQKKSSKFKLALTFDDGYENWYSLVFPIIKKLKIPVTFFISRPKGVNYLWLDIVDIYISACVNPIKIDQFYFQKSVNKYIDNKKNVNLKSWLEEQTNLSNFHKVKALFEIELGCDYESFDPTYWRLLSEEQIKELANSDLVEIGSHCISHLPLTNLNTNQIGEELFESKHILESITGKPIKSIAYPIGMYNSEILDVAEKIGYQHQLAVNYKLQSDFSDKRVLSRIGVYSDYSVEEQVRHFINDMK